MKSCAACNYENEDDADFCARCGAHLTDVKAKPQIEKKDDDCFGSEENECFGLPYGGAICGLIFGIVIILWAVGPFIGLYIWDYFWPFILFIFGALIIAGAIYSMRRRRS